MSDLKRYEEELVERLKKLSSNNKDLVWDKIEALLDKDDDKAPPLFPPSNSGNNFGWWLLGLLLLLTGLWGSIHFFRKDNLVVTNNKTQTTLNNYSVVKTTRKKTDKENKPVNSTIKNNLFSDSLSTIPLLRTNNKTCFLKPTIKNSNTVFNKKTIAAKTKKVTIAGKVFVIKTKAKFTSTITSANPDEEIDQQDLHQEISSTDITKHLQTITQNQPKDLTDSITQLQALTQKQSKDSTDSINQKNKPEIKIAAKTIANSSVTKKKINKKQYHWAVGIALQQPIRLNYTLIYPSDDNSAVSSITSYLPSIYAKFYHKNKWFIQAEFKYAAPQDIQEFIYKVNLQNEVFKDIVTSYTLKKVYNNEASVSFHYFITPNWSIGSGILYSIFSGADIEKDVHQKQYDAKDLLLGSVNITDKEDSGFSTLMKNSFSWLFETQYKWKNFSLGLRYNIGLQPFVKYIDPYSGLLTEKNNSSLNIFLRYQLWKSDKKDEKSLFLR